MALQRLSRLFSRRAWRAWSIRNWDKVKGLDFVTVVEPTAVGLDSNEVFRSSPSGNRYLNATLRALRISETDRIIDVGCGKGSAMRSMLCFPFGGVEGVELSPTIYDIARVNFEKIRDARVVIHQGDATSFEGYGKFNLFYFYNPFPHGVMRRVLARILAERPLDKGESLFIYNNPTCHEVFLDYGLQHLVTFPDEWGNGIFVYSNVQAASSRLMHYGER